MKNRINLLVYLQLKFGNGLPRTLSILPMLILGIALGIYALFADSNPVLAENFIFAIPISFAWLFLCYFFLFFPFFNQK